MTDYLSIAEHGVIGDLHTVALVGTDGTIDWYCTPRFDSPSVFASILDAGKGGYYRIAPVVAERAVKQFDSLTGSVTARVGEETGLFASV